MNCRMGQCAGSEILVHQKWELPEIILTLLSAERMKRRQDRDLVSHTRAKKERKKKKTQNESDTFSTGLIFGQVLGCCF